MPCMILNAGQARRRAASSASARRALQRTSRRVGGGVGDDEGGTGRMVRWPYQCGKRSSGRTGRWRWGSQSGSELDLARCRGTAAPGLRRRICEPRSSMLVESMESELAADSLTIHGKVQQGRLTRCLEKGSVQHRWRANMDADEPLRVVLEQGGEILCIPSLCALPFL